MRPCSPQALLRRLAVYTLAGLTSQALVTPVDAQSVVSRFEGSIEKGVYDVDYDALLYAETIAADAPIQRVEGSLVSRVYTKPDNKSNLELFRSYERELSAAGFSTIVAATPSRELKQFIWDLYRPPHTDLDARDYRNTEGQVLGTDLGRLRTFADYYLLGSRQQGGETLFVAVIVSRDQNLYLVEEVTTAAMETGTVSLSLDHIRSGMEAAGKVAVYDIHFATGSADLEVESEAALAVISTYLEETDGGYYIVGHTDDTGSMEGNVELSRQRAAAVKKALVEQYGISSERLETGGVGPLAPASQNATEAGRMLNRRVEIVKRIDR